MRSVNNNLPAMEGAMQQPPFMIPPDFKIYQMNKRLQERVDDCDNQWWDAFATEFFDDKATYTLSFLLEDGLKRYTIGRTLIPRFFRTMFESGVLDMQMNLRNPKDYSNMQTNTVTLDCDHATMVMHHLKPVHTKVYSEGHLNIDFMADEYMRIRSWHFSMRNHVEYIPKQIPLHNSNPAILEDLCKNITRHGLTTQMLNYLKMCVIIEPMKELMSRQKTFHMEPRECLRNCLFQKWQRMLNPPTDSVRGNKRQPRKRKNSTSTTTAGNIQKKKGINMSDSEVLMVTEPTLMGSEFGEEDERMITRLENNQFDNQNLHIKAEDISTGNFPSISSPSVNAPGQWAPNTTKPQITPASIAITKTEISENPTNTTTPLSTSG